MSPPSNGVLRFVRIGLGYCGRISRLWPGNEGGPERRQLRIYQSALICLKGPPYLVRVILCLAGVRLPCTVLSGSHNVENENGKCSYNDNDNNQGKQCPVYMPLIYRKRKRKRPGS